MTSTPKVLVVDDVAISRRMLSAMLKRVNARIDEVEDGRSAVEAMRRHGYELVFMDLIMPGMDGLEAMRIIRSDIGVMPQPMIVAVSSVATDETRSSCLQAGADDLLLRPVRYEDVLRIVGACHARSGATGHRGQAGGTWRLFEREELLRRVGGDESIAVLLAQEFVMHVETVMTRIKDALDRGDAGAFHDHVGTLKDMLMYFSSPLSLFAEEMGHVVPAGRVADAGSYFAKLSREVEDLTGEIERFVREAT